MANFQLIRKFADEKKISMRELASRISKDETTLQAIIRNGSTNTKTIEDIARVLEVSVGSFFDEPTSNTGSVTQSVRSSRNVNQIAGEQSNSLLEIIREKDRQIDRLLGVIERNITEVK
jgi:transcriptional regulator with XRE-family HTH domain